MSAPAGCKLIGRWRIVGADIWERGHLDLCGPATITISDHGSGEVAFGALQASLEIEYSRDSVGFTWEGSDKLMKFVATARPNCSTTAPSKSSSPIMTATRPCSKRNGILLQQPASFIWTKSRGSQQKPSEKDRRDKTDSSSAC